MANIVPVRKEQHQNLKLAKTRNISHVAGQHIIPVAAAEYAQSSASFPIVLVKNPDSPRFRSVAMLGLEAGENLFYQDDKWTALSMPQSISMVPFSLGIDPDKENTLTACIDLDSEFVGEDKDLAIFEEDGKESEVLTNVQQALGRLFDNERMTENFIKELQERVRTKLLEEGLIAEADELTNALIGTVHGLGVKLLKRFAFEAGVSPEVDIIADEDQQTMFNQSLAAILTPKLISTMEALAERLGLNKKERYDWRIEVKRLTDIARANAMDLPTLEKSKRNSIDSFFQLLNAKKTTLSVDDFNNNLLELLDTTIQTLINNDDSTKTTKGAINTFKQFQIKLQNKGELNWHEWAKITKTASKVGKKSREDAKELKEFAEKVEENPAFQADIKAFISNLFDLAISAIKEYDTYKKRRGLIDYIDMNQNVMFLPLQN